jgi:Spy/CpxP family protein refolding chaperone
MRSDSFSGCAPHHRDPDEGHGCGCESHPHAHRHFSNPSAEGAGFGVRRPLRFLAWRLQLTEAQVTEMARILNELKTERAQAEVDERRALTAFADAVAGETFDEAASTAAAAERVRSTERVQAQVVKSLAAIHALLEPEQRARLAYLIRTGALMM